MPSFHSAVSRNYFDMKDSPGLEVEEAPRHDGPGERERGTDEGGVVGVDIEIASARAAEWSSIGPSYDSTRLLCFVSSAEESHSSWGRGEAPKFQQWVGEEAEKKESETIKATAKVLMVRLIGLNNLTERYCY